MVQHMRFNIAGTNRGNFLLKLLSHWSGMKNRILGSIFFNILIPIVILSALRMIEESYN